MSKDTSRTASPTFSENITLLLSSLQNFHTFNIQPLHENCTSPDFFIVSGSLVLVMEAILISKLLLPFFPFIFQSTNINSQLLLSNLWDPRSLRDNTNEISLLGRWTQLKSKDLLRIQVRVPTEGRRELKTSWRTDLWVFGDRMNEEIHDSTDLKKRVWISFWSTRRRKSV